MRPIPLVFTGKRRSGSQKARIAPHDDVNLHAAKRTVVQVIALDGVRNKPRRRPEARRVVAAAEVVVNRLGNVVDNQRIVLLLGLFGDNACGIRRIVPEIGRASCRERG